MAAITTATIKAGPVAAARSSARNAGATVPGAYRAQVQALSARVSIGGASARALTSASASRIARPTRAARQSIVAQAAKDDEEHGPTLVLMRHGESFWNLRNLFTGCVDVPLTENGVDEAIKAGKRIADIPIDIIFVSQLVRAQMTALIAMTQHTPGKVPIMIHDEDERAINWSKIFSKATEEQCIPVIRSFELNERMYGELQGLNKAETAEKYGDEQVVQWRRSYDVPPPNGESLEMTAERSVKYFVEEVEPLLKQGKNVMISAHGNSLRAIIMHLEGLTPEEVVLLELFTAIPMVYEYIGDKYITRGSPLGDDVPGVYAVSAGLAKYKDVLETIEKDGYSS